MNNTIVWTCLLDNVLSDEAWYDKLPLQPDSKTSTENAIHQFGATITEIKKISVIKTGKFQPDLTGISN